MKKRLVVLALAGAMMAASLTGCTSFDGSQAAITIDGEVVTADVANFFARYMQSSYETYMGAYLGEGMWTTEVEEGITYEDSVKSSVIQSLEAMYLQEMHMEDYGVTLTDEEKAEITETAAAFVEANEADVLGKVSGSQETVERALTLITIQKKVGEAIMADVDTEVSDEEAAQKKMQYVMFNFTTTDEEGNTVELTEEELAALKADAEAFAEGVLEADDFAAYAEDKGYTATDATFDAENIYYEAALIEAADALAEGEVSAVIEGSGAYYVAQLVSEFDKDATEAKKEEIISERKNELYTAAVEEWMAAVEIIVNEEVWADIDFTKLSVKEVAEEAAEE